MQKLKEVIKYREETEELTVSAIESIKNGSVDGGYEVVKVVYVPKTPKSGDEKDMTHWEFEVTKKYDYEV